MKARQDLQRIPQPEQSIDEVTGALSHDERAMVVSVLRPGEAVFATVRAWDAGRRMAWALTGLRVAVTWTDHGVPHVTSISLDEIERLDSLPAGLGTSLWLYTRDRLIGLHLANADEAERFVRSVELLRHEALVLRITA